MAPAKVGGRAGMKFLNVGMSMMTGTLGKLLGGQLLRDVQTFVAAMDTMFGGFRTRADATYQLLQAPGTAFLVVAAPERDALREAAYFVERLAAEDMPLAGLVLNRVHGSGAAQLSAERALAAAENLDESAALWIRTVREELDVRDSPDTYGSSRIPQSETPASDARLPSSARRPRPRHHATDRPPTDADDRRSSSPRACCGCTPSACRCSPASSARATASPRSTPRWRWPKWPRCPAMYTTSRGCGPSVTGSRPGSIRPELRRAADAARHGHGRRADQCRLRGRGRAVTDRVGLPHRRVVLVHLVVVERAGCPRRARTPCARSPAACARR